MSTKLIVAKDEMSVEDAVRLLVNNKVTGLPVVDSKGMLVGVLSEYDIIATVSDAKQMDGKIFKDKVTFTKVVESVSENTLLPEILKTFVEKKVRRLPVLDNSGRLIGIISRRDIMKVMYYRAKVQG